MHNSLEVKEYLVNAKAHLSCDDASADAQLLRHVGNRREAVATARLAVGVERNPPRNTARIG